ncbi:MAG: hypothetical protein M3461_22865 [Pseudomonadota bacterium]|nr:hypothetical protein [Pseudomonadota bacterium]
MQVAEIDAQLEMLLNNVLDEDRGLHGDAPRAGVLREQRSGVEFDCLLGEIANLDRHVVAIVICTDNVPESPDRGL